MKRNEIYVYGCLIFLTIAGLATWSMAENKYSIKEMTPEVKAALDVRRGQFDQLEALKNSGDIGENNSGYVQALTDNSEAKAVADTENSNRKVIYQAIADQNGLEDAIATIEKVFAQVQRDKASSGQKIQLEDGSWVIK